MATLQQKLKNRINSLNELDDFTVESTEELGQVFISRCKHHVADFRLKWVDGSHYVGYFVDSDGKESQAIISLWTAMEAVKFTALYSSIVELRAKRDAAA